MLEPFSMKEEREIGNITKEGFYAINKQKEKQQSDRWLDSLLTGSEQQLLEEKNNQLAQERLEYKVQPKRSEITKEDENENRMIEEVKCEHLKKLINLLEDKQHVNQAMNFLKAKLPAQTLKLKKNIRKKVKKEEEKHQNSDQILKEQSSYKEKLAEIVSITTYLVNKCNCFDLYTKTKEQLVNELEIEQKLVEKKFIQIKQEEQKNEEQIFSDIEEKKDANQIEAQKEQNTHKESEENESESSDSSEEEEQQEGNNSQYSEESEDSYEEEMNMESRKKGEKQIQDSLENSDND